MLRLKISAISDATARVKRIELISTDESALPSFKPGAHIDVHLSNGESRSYSLLNDARESHRYVLGILREENGLGASCFIHDNWRMGDEIACDPPSNDFPLYEAGDYYVLIAGGIGITPIMSMAARLAELGREYVLHYCARSEKDAIFLDELRLAHGARLVTHLDGGDPARGLNVADLMKTPKPGCHVYVCGPAGLIRSIREAGTSWGKGTIHYELFKGSEADVTPGGADAEFDIVLNRSGTRLHVPTNKSILEVLKENGQRIKTLCRAGTCGTCTVAYLSGKVDHRDDVLDDDDRATHLQVCVSRAIAGETLVLDL